MGDDKPQYLQIRNWEKFQVCDRDAPWIKLYTALLQNYDFLNQNDNQKAALVCLWLYVGRHGNKIPKDEKFLSSIFCLDDSFNIDDLVTRKFLEPFDDDHYTKVKSQHDLKIDARRKKDRLKKRSDSENRKSDSENTNSDLPETETETEIETKTDTNKDTPPYSPPIEGARKNRDNGKQPRKRKPKAAKQNPLDMFQEQLFNQVVEIYPKPKKLDEARQAWANLVPPADQSLVDRILKTLEWQIPEWLELSSNNQYTPGLAPYINGHMWQDRPTKRIGSFD